MSAAPKSDEFEMDLNNDEAENEQIPKGHGSKFGYKMEAAIAALLTSRSIEEAAKTVGISPQTLMRWMKYPKFDAEYRKAQRDFFGQALARLVQSAPAAVVTLQKIMVDKNSPAGARVRSAQHVLDHAQKAIEVSDLAARLGRVERRMASATRTRKKY
jgi:hypothetical protein